MNRTETLKVNEGLKENDDMSKTTVTEAQQHTQTLNQLIARREELRSQKFDKHNRLTELAPEVLCGVQVAIEESATLKAELLPLTDELNTVEAAILKTRERAEKARRAEIAEQRISNISRVRDLMEARVRLAAELDATLAAAASLFAQLRDKYSEAGQLALLHLPNFVGETFDLYTITQDIVREAGMIGGHQFVTPGRLTLEQRVQRDLDRMESAVRSTTPRV